MFGQVEVHDAQEEFHVVAGLSVARQNDGSSITGGQMHVDHLQRLELFESLTRCQAFCMRAQLLLEGDVQAVGQEGNEDMGFHALFVAMVYWPDGKVALEVAESPCCPKNRSM